MAGDQPCTKEQVKTLSDAAAKRTIFIKGDTSNMVAKLELGPAGSLVCATTDGKKCAAAQVTQLNSVAAALPAASGGITGAAGPGNTKPK